MILTPDNVTYINGVKVNQYLLTDNKNNPNKIAMPAGNRKKTVAITVHNTNSISVASGTTEAEQYTRATRNNAMDTVRVHFYVDDYCAWQNLPLDYVNWSCADGTANPNSGNNTTVAIEVIGSTGKAEANAIKLIAYLLNKYNLTVESGLRSHTYWLNVRDGVSGSIDYLNTRKHPYKWCPLYILPHWDTFKSQCAAALASLKTSTGTSAAEMYRIRKSWAEAGSQIGAYTSLENAKKAWKEGYVIYNSKGEAVYPTSSNSTPAAQPSKPAQSTTPAKPTTPTKNIDVIYKVRTNKWLGEIKNCNDTNDMGYAGIERFPIRCLMAKVSEGVLHYRVHIIGGGWLGWITKYNINDWYNGYAGLPTQQIDGVQAYLTGVDGYEVQYRVSSAQSNSYYPWVTGLNDYAGVFGRTIDKVQMKIVKK